MNGWMNVGENPNRLSLVQGEMAGTSAREPRGLALALALVHCESDLVGTNLLRHP